MTSDASDDLVQVLTESQRLGFLGSRPVTEVVEHARAFVDGLDGVTGSVVDLGAGGGVPGLVIAQDRPDLALVMVDRRAKRTDFLRRVVSRLGWSSRIEVVNDDVLRLVDRVPDSFDAAVARGFGPPDTTLTLARRLIVPSGRVVISEPPTGDRWSPELLTELGVSRRSTPGSSSSPVVVFERDGFT